MEIIRCGQCNKMLAQAVFTRLSIKCPRCGTLNQLRAYEPLTSMPGASYCEVSDGKADHPLGRRKTQTS